MLQCSLVLLTGFFILCFAAVVKATTCPELFPILIEEKCYYFQLKLMEVNAAYSKCVNQNGTFAIIKSPGGLKALEEIVNEIVSTELEYAMFWIGLRLDQHSSSRYEVDREWIFTYDNSRFVQKDYSLWDHAEGPTDRSLACAALNASSGLVKAVNCNRLQLKVICIMAMGNGARGGSGAGAGSGSGAGASSGSGAGASSGSGAGASSGSGAGASSGSGAGTRSGTGAGSGPGAGSGSGAGSGAGSGCGDDNGSKPYLRYGEYCLAIINEELNHGKIGNACYPGRPAPYTEELRKFVSLAVKNSFLGGGVFMNIGKLRNVNMFIQRNDGSTVDDDLWEGGAPTYDNECAVYSIQPDDTLKLKTISCNYLATSLCYTEPLDEDNDYGTYYIKFPDYSILNGSD